MNAFEQDASAAWTSEWMTKIERMLVRLPDERADTVRRRIQDRGAALHADLRQLYGSSDQFDNFFESLIELAVQSAGTRGAALWDLDLQREAQPYWLHAGMTGYCTYVDKFAGTLDGVADRIPYLQELGITYLHLLPFLKAGTPPNDGGFAVASFSEVAPELGTMTSLSSLSTRLRGAGISLCSDLVLNHVSEEHPWAVAAANGDEIFRGYFHWCADQGEVANWEEHLGQVFPDTAPGNFTYVDQAKAWVWSTFYPYQWDLNWSNHNVFAAMADALLNLANHGVEAFRLDSTGYLWKRKGTTSVNQPEAHTILQALRALCDIAAPGLLLKAEAIMPTRELPPYFGLGEQVRPECHLAYHSSLMAATWLSLSENSDDAVRQVLHHTPNLPGARAWLSYVRCHDDIGWNVLRPDLAGSTEDTHQRLLRATQHYCGRDGRGARGARFQAVDDTSVHGTNGMTLALLGAPAPGQEPDPPATDRALRRMALAQSLSFFVGGIPLIYMGDELGQDNVSRRELIERAGPDDRELHRPGFDAQAAAQRSVPHTLAGRCFAFLSSLSRLRKAWLSDSRSPIIEVVEPSVPGLLVLRNGTLLGLFNFAHEPVSVELLKAFAPDWRSKASIRLSRILGTGCEPAAVVNIEDAHQPFVLPPHGHAWIASTSKPLTTPEEVAS